MKFLQKTVAVLSLAALLAACGSPLDPAGVESVSPTSHVLGSAVRITVEGSGMYLPTGGDAAARGVQIEVCGTEVTDIEVTRLDSQSVAMAPGGTRTLYRAAELSGTLGSDAQPGLSDVTVTLPGGETAVLQDAFECIAPEQPEEPGEPDAPVAVITTTPDPATGFAPLSVTFSGTDSTPGSGSITSYAWDLGAGPATGDATLSHTFEAPGDYTVTLTVTDSAGGEAQASVPVTVTAAPPGPSITIAPAEAALVTGGSQEFTAQVHNLDDTEVTWSLSGEGSLDDSSTNPVTFTAGSTSGTVVLTATSVADPEVSASVSIAVGYPSLTVSMNPAAVTIQPPEQQVFTATVEGWVDTDVSWAVSPEPAVDPVIDGDELTFEAAADDIGGTFTLTATSVANPGQQATATVTVTDRLANVVDDVTAALCPLELAVLPGEPQQLVVTGTQGSCAGGSDLLPVTPTGDFQWQPSYLPSSAITALPGGDVLFAVNTDKTGDCEGTGGLAFRLVRATEQFTDFAESCEMGLQDEVWFAGEAVELDMYGPDHALLLYQTVDNDIGFLLIDVTDDMEVVAEIELDVGEEVNTMWVDDRVSPRHVLIGGNQDNSTRRRSFIWIEDFNELLEVSGSTANCGHEAIFSCVGLESDNTYTDLTGNPLVDPDELLYRFIVAAYVRNSEAGDGREMLLDAINIFEVNLGPTGTLGIQAINADEDGNFYVSGESLADTGLTRAFIAKIDQEGNVVWREDYGEDGRNVAATTSLLDWGEDQLVMAGYSTSADGSDTQPRIWYVNR